MLSMPHLPPPPAPQDRKSNWNWVDHGGRSCGFKDTVVKNFARRYEFTPRLEQLNSSRSIPSKYLHVVLWWAPTPCNWWFSTTFHWRFQPRWTGSVPPPFSWNRPKNGVSQQSLRSLVRSQGADGFMDGSHKLVAKFMAISSGKSIPGAPGVNCNVWLI